MWPFSSYPEHSPSSVDGKTYDYVIVGGGTAGCVVASRLSEANNVSVLVIEKGHVNDNIVSRMPLLSQNMFLGDILQVQSNRWSEPLPSVNRRRSRLWAVEGIGGATRMNGMLWTRGFPGDYAAWSEMGLGDWTYNKVEPYFRKIENATVHPKSEARGHGGPIELRQFQFPFEWTSYLNQAIKKLGLRLEKDINNPAAPAMGSFTLDTAIDNRGNRISALTAYLSKKLAFQRRDNLTICTGTVASRLEADSQTGLVTGVYIQNAKGPPGKFFVKVRREVIMCAGAACTHQPLLLSSIGPADSAENFDIPLIKELPAVGATLSDHYSIPIMLEIPRKETLHILETLWGIWHLLLWLFTGKGTFQVKNHDEEGHDNLDASLARNVPDIEIMVIPNSSVERAVEGHAFMSLYPTLVQPRGSGLVELATVRAKLAFAPGQDPTMLEEWERVAPIDYLPVPAQPVSSLPGSVTSQANLESPTGATTRHDFRRNKTWKDVTDNEIDDCSRRVAHTSLHFSGTCPMSNDDKSGVVDQKLLVYGFSNLRIADTSVFPKIPSCYTMAPVMMVAERCADLAKEAWEGRKSQ
ncbi:putative GMC oxidoreductase [Daldinia eschscholtzii]|nr:putative GMC oxidoreductase [Daldinia eschscholtzii]